MSNQAEFDEAEGQTLWYFPSSKSSFSTSTMFRLCQTELKLEKPATLSKFETLPDSSRFCQHMSARKFQVALYCCTLMTSHEIGSLYSCLFWGFEQVYLQKVWSLLCIVSPNLTRLADPSASESESNDFDRFWLLGSFDEVWEVKNWKEARGRLRNWRANKEHIRSVLRLLSRSLNRSMKCGMWTDFDSFSSCVGTLDSLQYYHDWIESLNVVDRASMCWCLGLWCCMAYLDHEWVLHDGINCL